MDLEIWERGNEELDFDFAMAHLKTSVHFGRRAIPACLPKASWGGDFLAGKLMTVSGWGRLSYRNFTHPNVLQSVRVPGITNARCREVYQPREANYSTPITESMLCAGDLGKGGIDACMGDSGGKFLESILYKELFNTAGLTNYKGCVLDVVGHTL